jgi:hypothetical protein
MRELLWKPELFQVAAGFTRTTVAKYGPHSFLPFFRDVTVQKRSRMNDLNACRAITRTDFGLDPLTSFDQLGVDDPDATVVDL